MGWFKFCIQQASSVFLEGNKYAKKLKGFYERTGKVKGEEDKEPLSPQADKGKS